MPLIQNKPAVTKVNLKGKEISSEVYKTAEDYCDWAAIDDMSVLLEEALLYVFKSDKEWKAFNKNKSKKSAELES